MVLHRNVYFLKKKKRQVKAKYPKHGCDNTQFIQMLNLIFFWHGWQKCVRPADMLTGPEITFVMFWLLSICLHGDFFSLLSMEDQKPDTKAWQAKALPPWGGPNLKLQ